MNKNFNRIKFGILIFIGGIILLLINDYFKSRTVHFKKYDFVVTKVENTPTGGVTPFHNDIEIDMWQYDFFPYNCVKVGDSIHKGAEQKYLYIFRRDETQKFILIDSIQPTGIYSWPYKNE
ncbi:hypothetical protein SAMN06265349_1011224 [Flavobacterium resistens]|uniref:Uncharacterized protein n=1 Tax=Flavobacterium resistens TaxID=443612 RepID=A0A521BNM0_9FLAO|nr:hypothetical protein [Flavobacterium resistens]MRX67533.1 hypothetical protein [Flavobacterium resistens]SMO48351.1 hypothetical protein SAMN06265349_1011224 [Flavobacterium resistens]